MPEANRVVQEEDDDDASDCNKPSDVTRVDECSFLKAVHGSCDSDEGRSVCKTVHKGRLS